MPLQVRNAWKDKRKKTPVACNPLQDEIDRLREYVRLLESVIENFPGGISLYDNELRMMLCNEQQKRMLDYPEELTRDDLPSMEELFRFNAERGEYGPGSVEGHVERRMDLVLKKVPHCYERERPNGDVVQIRGIPLESGGFVTTYLDVTQQRRDQKLIEHMAQHDVLTDLPNRILFADRLKTAVAHAKRGGCMALIYLDLDGFKPVNDRFGHAAGDELLQQVAGRLLDAVRESDTVARLGGDEFAIVQTCIHCRENAEVLAKRVLNVIAQPFEVQDTTINISVSLGIVLAPDQGTEGDELLRKADAALYDSKRNGRNRFSFFEEN